MTFNTLQNEAQRKAEGFNREMDSTAESTVATPQTLFALTFFGPACGAHIGAHSRVVGHNSCHVGVLRKVMEHIRPDTCFSQRE